MLTQSKKPKRSGRSVLDFGSTEEIACALNTERQRVNPTTAPSLKMANSDWLLTPCSDHADAFMTQDVQNEAKRLAVLKDYLILESGTEKPFDKVSEKVATKFGVSWAMISLVDMGRLWFKSLHRKDLGVTETPREFAFCAHAIQSKEDTVFEVNDAFNDACFSQYTLVQNNPGVQFYAGVPLTVPEGVRIGTLCLMDDKPRPNGLNMAEQAELKRIAEQVVEVLVKRKNALQKFKQQASSAQAKIQSAQSKTQAVQPKTPVPPATNVESTDRAPPSPRKPTLKHVISTVKRESPSSEADLKKSRTGSLLKSTSSCGLIPRPVNTDLLPDPKTDGVDPDTYLSQLVQAMYGTKLVLKTAFELGNFFPDITEDQMNAYSMEVVSVARANDVKRLEEIVDSRGRDSLDCFNRFGEGLLNLCCRRGFTESVKFLLSDKVGLNVRIRDDCGRTPLHDACWNPEPQIDICRAVMEKDPSLFFITDKRGYTPFQYARNTDWPLWRQFLLDSRHLLAPLAMPEIRQHFT
ncbi:hypothetical protein ACA910_021507 [Epithemia clementina (nom. ined.)]